MEEVILAVDKDRKGDISFSQFWIYLEKLLKECDAQKKLSQRVFGILGSKTSPSGSRIAKQETSKRSKRKSIRLEDIGAAAHRKVSI